MPNYQVLIKPSVKKDLKRVPPAVIKRLKDITQELSRTPFPPQAKPLQGYKNVFRYRFSHYRVIYQVDPQHHKLTILKFGHRQQIYRHF